MPAYHLLWTDTYLRTARKFIRRHPELGSELEDVLKQLEDDPRAPRLRLHALQSKHRGKHAVSLTYSHRIVLVLRVVAKEIVLLDIGTHDEVYRS
jgi:mRNA-degrading endonuclease YafQ of YafQ-DinJ toxin-antitoxin module